MSDDKLEIVSRTCGVPEKCPKAPANSDGKHDWSGEPETSYDGLEWWVTCANCGVGYNEWGMWNLP